MFVSRITGVVICLGFLLVSCVSAKKESMNNTANNQNNTCGNGIIDPGEQCDDGNTVDHDGCTSNCIIEGFCGNSTVEPSEECDDGNYKDGDGCSRECQLEKGCGNGRLEVGEQCDDDNVVSGDGCSGDCLIEGANPVCGNGIFEYNEGCDDGNTTPGDGCSATCKREDGCGDGTQSETEQCDDGNNISGDGCSADCYVEFICGNRICDEEKGETCHLCPQDCCPDCGNNKLDSGEECDDGNNINNDGCSRGCLDEDGIATCGNGIIEFSEQCDDGNTTSRDGCSATCAVEWICGDGECTADFGETCERCNIDCCPSCGNGIVQPAAGERCDTDELNGRTCEFFGYTGGELRCTSFCDFDFSNCTGPGPICGNGEVEYGEQCDGSNLNFQDCNSLGYLDGTLFCSGCRFNTSGCSGHWRYFYEDFEDNNNEWTIGGNTWQIGTLGSDGPASLPSGTNCAATNLSGNYANNMSWAVDCIQTADIDLTTSTHPILLFHSWWRTEVNYDGGRVQVYSNSTWVNPTSLTPAYNKTLGSQSCWAYDTQEWMEHRVDLTPYSGQTIQLRFCFYSDSITNYAGWYIDDIQIVESIYIPIVIETSADLGRALVGIPFERQLTITNGSGDFTFMFLGQAPAWLSLDSHTGRLFGTPQASDLGTHSFTIRVIDNVNSANATNKDFTVSVVNGVWMEDFTNGLPSGWSLSGGVWQVGVPTYTSGPSSCPSAPNCAGTNLSGPYNVNMAWDAHCITTGAISLAGLQMATLSFLSWWDTETGFDGGRVQVYSNGAWGNPPTVTPTYNKTLGLQDCWAYNDKMWKEHTVDLTPYAGQTIQLRFCFYSDGSVQYAGWYIDDLMILGN